MTSTPAPIRFGPFTLDVAAGRLLRDGRPVSLRPRPFDVLVALASRPGELVTKNELLDAVWGTRFVTEGVIKTAVAELRVALGEDSREPTWLHTVPRRGYRFESGATRPAAPAIDAGALLGRDAALRPIAAAWQEACAGRRGFVLVSGEPGVGKTALLEHFVSGLDDARVLAGACTEAWAGAEPYQPLLDALAHACKLDPGLVASLRATAPTWLLQLPWLTDETVRLSLQQATAGASQERMIRELSTWLEQLALRQPVLVLIEDLHWADPATVQWLGSLASRRAPARLLVVGSMRPPELALSASPFGALRTELRLRQQIREVPLAGLGPDDVAALVHRELGGETMGHDQVLALHRFTDGLPLFVLGLAREWREQPDSMRLNVPADLGAVIDRQCERLPLETRRLLETAALAAAEFDHLTLAHALDLPPDAVREQLEDLIRRQIWLRASGSIVLGDGRLGLQCTFGHALVRHALASRLGLVQRAERHRRLAAALEALQPQRAESLAPDLARHHREGQQPLQAARQLAVVARVALQRHAPREAQAAADAGLAQLSRVPAGAPADTVQDVRLALDSLRLTAVLQLQGLASPESRTLIAQVLSQVSTLPVGDATLPVWQVILLSHFAGRLPGTSSLVAVFGARAAHGSVAAQAIAASAQGVEHLHNGRIAQSLASFTQSLALCDRIEGNVALLRDPRFGAWAYLALVAPVAGDAELARRAWAAVDDVI
ncbi:MAG: AAA family ATPase [Rubrivivax sp.]|nr:AAA family ATPase [Rubrivivax sp.]